MNCTIIIDTPEFVGGFGRLKAKHSEHKMPFKLCETVWYAHKKRNKWVVRESDIIEFWATNIVGVRLNNHIRVPEADFDKLFRNKEDAISFCLKKNQQSTVKVYTNNNY